MTDLSRLLTDLPGASPDPSRSARTRARSHAALAARQRRPARSRRPRPVWEPLLAGGGGIYVVEVIRQAILTYGGL